MTEDSRLEITVIIPNWNGRAIIGECLDALSAQQGKTQEIIVVDNGSTDDSVAYVREKHPTVILIQLPENRGFSAAVNAGIRAAKGQFVALLNNDAVPDAKWLRSLLDALSRRTEFAFAASRVLYYDRRDTIDTAGDAYTPWGMVFARGHNEKAEGRFEIEDEVFGACACAALYKRELFDDVGLFDENFFAYYEDVDWSFRARLRGHRCLYVPDAVVYHRYSAASSGQTSKLGREEVYLHITGVLLKNMPCPLLLKHLPSILFFQSLIVFFCALARVRRANRLPRVPFIRFMLAMLRERKRIQRGRKVAPRALYSQFTQRSLREYLKSESAR